MIFGKWLIMAAVCTYPVDAAAQSNSALEALVDFTKSLPGKTQYMQIPFPQCVMQLTEARDLAEYRKTILRGSVSVDLKVGWARGTLAFNKKNGDALVEVLCGSGLAAVTATPM